MFATSNLAQWKQKSLSTSTLIKFSFSVSIAEFYSVKSGVTSHVLLVWVVIRLCGWFSQSDIVSQCVFFPEYPYIPSHETCIMLW